MNEFIIITVVLLYLMPAVIASRNDHKNLSSIAVVNVFLGWTFLGWVVALAWAVKRD